MTAALDYPAPVRRGHLEHLVVFTVGAPGVFRLSATGAAVHTLSLPSLTQYVYSCSICIVVDNDAAAAAAIRSIKQQQLPSEPAVTELMCLSRAALSLPVHCVTLETIWRQTVYHIISYDMVGSWSDDRTRATEGVAWTHRRGRRLCMFAAGYRRIRWRWAQRWSIIDRSLSTLSNADEVPSRVQHLDGALPVQWPDEVGKSLYHGSPYVILSW